jgi:hypothetical protein
MILITQFWMFKSTDQKNDIYRCLMENCKNRYIKKIIVYIEKNCPLHLKHPKIVTKKVPRRLSYQELIYTASQYNETCVISNANVSFDDTITKLYNIDKSVIYNISNKAIAVSSNKVLSNTSKILIGNITDIEYSNIVYVSDVNAYQREVIIEKVEPLVKIKHTEVQMKNKKKMKIISTEPNLVSGVNRSKPKYDKRVLVHLHLYYQDLFEEMMDKISNLDGKCYYDVYITLTEGVSTKGQVRWLNDQISDKFNITMLEVPNKGLDIGPFLLVLERVRMLCINYDYVLKLHTKKSLITAENGFGNKWRNELVNKLISTPEVFENNLKQMLDDNIAMLGSRKWLTANRQGNDKYINYYIDKFSIQKHNSMFIGGTIFMVRYDLLTTYITDPLIVYEELETGYFHDQDESRKTHSLERIFGYMVSASGKKILGV